MVLCTAHRLPGAVSPVVLLVDAARFRGTDRSQSFLTLISLTLAAWGASKLLPASSRSAKPRTVADLQQRPSAAHGRRALPTSAPPACPSRTLLAGMATAASRVRRAATRARWRRARNSGSFERAQERDLTSAFSHVTRLSHLPQGAAAAARTLVSTAAACPSPCPGPPRRSCRRVSDQVCIDKRAIGLRSAPPPAVRSPAARRLPLCLPLLSLQTSWRCSSRATRCRTCRRRSPPPWGPPT
jgi:hypothetical protein